MESLADYLGITPEGKPDAAAPETLSAKEFCDSVVNSFEFRSYILNGLLLGSIPAAVVNRIMDTAWGKLPDRVDHTISTNPLESMSIEQLEERALFLAQTARELRNAAASESKAVH